MNFYCELSKKDVKGADRIWSVSVTSGVSTTTWGQRGGKMQVQQKEYTEGKQKRTPHEQAVFEAKAIIVKKKREGWDSAAASAAASVAEDHSESKNAQVLEVRPLLAKPYVPESMPVTAQVFLQPKLDGMRCIADIESGMLWSRGGKIITDLPRIESAVRALYGFQVQYLDGELYVPGVPFSDLVSLVRNGSLSVQYHVYDCIATGPFSDRNGLLDALMITSPLFKVKTVTATVGSIEEWHNTFLEQGYEGTMIRTDKERSYRQGARSASLLKLKNFKDSEFLCTGLKQEKHEETLGSLECVTSTGLVFHARPKLSDEERHHLYRHPNEVVNHYVTVKYFEITEAGVPRFPVVIKIRPKQDL
jgi:ATP-dependent DNA ligase